MLTIDKEIINCDLAYSRCFSDCFENQYILRFCDCALQDMYDHNFTYIKNRMGDNKVLELIRNEISLRTAENQNFCKILSAFPLSASLTGMLTPHPEVDRLGFYSLCKAYYSDLKGNNDRALFGLTVHRRQMIFYILT